MNSENKYAPERTTTTEALLGMLSLRAMSGYEIRRTIEGSIGNFWHESYGQIYPTLKRLVADGLAEISSDTPQVRRMTGPSRTVYVLTEAGRLRLRQWLESPSTRQVPRNELLLKLFFAAQGPPGIVTAQVGEFRVFHESELRRYGQIREHLEREFARHPELPYWLMTLDYGEHESRAMVAWCDRTLTVSQGLEEIEYAR